MLLYNRNHYSIHAHEGRIDEEIMALLNTALEDHPLTQEEFEDGIEAYEHADPTEKVLFVAYHYDEPVGFLAAYKHNDVAAEEHWYIVPEHRRKGLTRPMLRLAQFWAKRIGCKELWTQNMRKENGWPTVTCWELK